MMLVPADDRRTDRQVHDMPRRTVNTRRRQPIQWLLTELMGGEADD